MSAKTGEVPATFAAGWLDQLDGRMNIARELRQRFAEVCADLGGKESLSYMERSLVERGLWLEYWLSQRERELAEGRSTFDVGKWTQANNALLGLWRTLGLERKARDVPDLQGYLRNRASGEAA